MRQSADLERLETTILEGEDFEKNYSSGREYTVFGEWHVNCLNISKYLSSMANLYPTKPLYVRIEGWYHPIRLRGMLA